MLSVAVKATSIDDVKGYLVPVPKSVELKEGSFRNASGRIICRGVSASDDLLRISTNVQKSLKTAGIDLPLAAVIAKGETATVNLKIDKSIVKEEQGYNISINDNRISIVANDAAGLFYASLTLSQLCKYADDNGYLPSLEIKDHPDFKRRGVTVDVSRCKVPKLEQLFKYIDMFASWKINEIQLYTEHTFKYLNHKKVWQDASPYSAEDILKINKYCIERFIDLVPNQNSFGHMERWLKHKEYWDIAECPEISDPNNFLLSRRRTICAVDQKSVDFADELYGELLPNFSSKYVNIGGDEPYELGHGRSKKACKKVGKGRVYLDFLKKLNTTVNNHGKSAQFWGDIIVKYPDLIKELPENITCMLWGYRYNHPYAKQCPKFKAAGIPFYVCPGTSSWRSIVGRTENSIQNQVNAAENGLKNGAIGYLNTDWGDYGHWQPYFTAYPAYIYGAAVSWSLKDNKDINYRELMNKYLFDDNSGELASIICDLGNSNQKATDHIFNMVYYTLLRYHDEPMSSKRLKQFKADKLVETKKYVESVIKRTTLSRALCNDSEILKREIINAGKLAIFACNMGTLKHNAKKGRLKYVSKDDKYKLLTELDEVINEHRELWVKRNRVGGLDESVANLEKIRNSLLK